MRIEDLIQLLNNRLREFKLAGDYARMNGDLERMNAADKEVIALENTLFKLNLLVDTSKSAAVKDAILAEVMTDGSVSVLGEYDITLYATDPLHEEKIMNILSKMAVMDTVEKIDDYITGKYLSSPVTGEMVMSAALAYEVDARLMMAIMEQDSRFGTLGVAVGTLNPGNVGNNDDGDTRTYESWQEGVTAVAEWLNRHRGSTIISEILEETVLEATATSTPAMATSTPPIITPTATSTPLELNEASSTFNGAGTSTSTPAIATSTPVVTTSQPEAGPPLAETTTTITNIPTTATSTPTTATSQPEAGPPLAETPLELNETSPTSNGAGTATTTPVTPDQDSSGSSGTGQAATSTPTTATSTPTMATSTPVTATSTEETIPITTSTTTTITTVEAGQATTTAN